MVVRETIAVIGIDDNIPFLIENLFEKDLSVLLINESKHDRETIEQQLETKNISAEVELTECAVNGCWEADMIVIFNFQKLKGSIIDKIKKVSIQKIVAVVMEEEETKAEQINAQSMFPLSKVVLLYLNSQNQKIIIKAEDKNSADHMKKFFDFVEA